MPVGEWLSDLVPVGKWLSGYGLVGSAKRDDLRFILVLNGMTSMRQRKQESSRLLNSAFREFKKLNLYKSNETVTEAKVFLGEKDKVPLIVKNKINLLLNSVELREMKVKAVWSEPISAPVKKDTVLGTLSIEIPKAFCKSTSESIYKWHIPSA